MNKDIKIRGVLFDFDGVLADTMKNHFMAWNEALRLYHTSIAAEAFYPLEGMPVPTMAGEICTIAGIGRECAAELLHEKEQYYLAHHSTELYSGVEEFVTSLYEKKIPMAIVSGGSNVRIRASTSPQFLNKFIALITSESTVRGKPYPDVYLKGAESIGVPVQECIVVENAPLGVTAAKSAGAYCVAITSTMPSAMLEGADEIVDSFEALVKTVLIRSLFV